MKGFVQTSSNKGMHVAELSEKHRGELQLATERALQQWAKDIFVPAQILEAMDRVLLFLKQNGGASKQARHVTSLAFVVGEQIVQLGGWKWMSVSEDGSLNPAIVSPDGKRAALLIDLVTLWLTGEARGSVRTLTRACLDQQVEPHDGVISL